MFVYALAKGAKNGWIDTKYLQYAKRGYNGFVQHMVRVDESGR